MQFGNVQRREHYGFQIDFGRRQIAGNEQGTAAVGGRLARTDDETDQRQFVQTGERYCIVM